jgi:hypothetical protein
MHFKGLVQSIPLYMGTIEDEYYPHSIAGLAIASLKILDIQTASP